MNFYGTFLASLLSVLILAEILNKSGYFKKAVYTLLLAAEGNCFRFYTSIMLFTVCTVFVLNDICIVLVFLPVLYDVLNEIEFNDSLIGIYLYSCFAVSEAASVCFPNCGIINMIYSYFFKISYTEYASKMASYGILAVLLCVFFLFTSFKKEIGKSFIIENIKNPDDMVRDWTMLNIEIAVICVLIAGYFASSFAGYDYTVILIICAVILAFFFFIRNTDKKIDKNLFTIFKVSFFITVVIAAARYLSFRYFSDAGIITYIYTKKELALSGIVQMFIASLINNVTTASIFIIPIEKLSAVSLFKKQIIYSGILFNDIGAAAFPFGSTAGVLFLKQMKQLNFNFKPLNYVKLSVKTIVPTFICIVVLFYCFAF